MSAIIRDDFEVKNVKDCFRLTKIKIRGGTAKKMALTKGDNQEKTNQELNFEEILGPYIQGNEIYNVIYKLYLDC